MMVLPAEIVPTSRALHPLPKWAIKVFCRVALFFCIHSSPNSTPRQDCSTMSYVPAPGYMPAYNPPLPYSKMIPGGLRPGMSIYVQGTVPKHTKRFRVNFSCGPQETADIALHFNPRFDGKDKIVLNTCQGGNWGTEQHEKMPLKKGKHFEIIFVINVNGYQLLVNGSPLCIYNHRIPPERVEVVSADGDLELQSLTVMGGAMTGVGGTAPYSAYGPSNLPTMTAPTSYHPQVPYLGNFPGGLGSKRTVVLRGFIPVDAKRFQINFKAGHQDIMLHINPRMDERTVVRNTFLNGRWGTEERELSFNPFQPGQYFDLSIRCGNQRFKVFANGQHLFDFNHRFHNFEQINTLEIDGDVVLSYIQY